MASPNKDIVTYFIGLFITINFFFWGLWGFEKNL